jgi:putative tricarboxylic transport membrane protein
MAGDPYKIVFGTSNAWTQPMVSKVAYNYTDLTPIAAMVQDEFLLWVKQDAPYQSVQDYLKAVAAKPAGDFKMGGAQSKDTDEVLTRLIDKAANVKFTYIPFKSGAEAAVQLAGGHIDSHVNNPSESIGQWKGSTQRPLCAFSPKRLPDGPKVTETQNWHDIPTCVESGLDIPQFEQPRTVWLPGKVTDEQAAFYVDLMKKVQATPEWRNMSSGPRRSTPSSRERPSPSSSTRTSSATIRSRPTRAGWFRTSSLLKNPKNWAFVLSRVRCWDNLFESLKRFGGLDAGLATLQPV